MRLREVIEAVSAVVVEMESYEERGEDVPSEVMERLKAVIANETSKANAIGNLLLRMDRDAEACGKEAASYKERERKLKARRERVARYVARMMGFGGIRRLEGTEVTCTYLKPRKKARIDDAAKLPDYCWRQPPTPDPVPDVEGIKRRLEEGEEVPGAALVEGDPGLRVYR